MDFTFLIRWTRPLRHKRGRPTMLREGSWEVSSRTHYTAHTGGKCGGLSSGAACSAHQCTRCTEEGPGRSCEKDAALTGIFRGFPLSPSRVPHTPAVHNSHTHALPLPLCTRRFTLRLTPDPPSPLLNTQLLIGRRGTT